MIVILTAIGFLYSQDVQFSVTADRTNASLGEQIMITAQAVSTKKFNSLSAPKLVKTEDFDVVSTNQNQSSSTSIQVVNGKMTQTVTMTYLFYYGITPKKNGLLYLSRPATRRRRRHVHLQPVRHHRRKGAPGRFRSQGFAYS